ncbi:hypothetical protein BOTNAR_0089g00070 [Botryotinia narcissicola]|uniref:BTB domain-containing protein n=1 Tax=Botryotinia narcissicola TaxID=278944 RepID=A0A4Z1IS89_9HELO|nr:hypothetical protein BOTNAR_0089g00070 [Botryotinia narcissicola]
MDLLQPTGDIVKGFKLTIYRDTITVDVDEVSYHIHENLLRKDMNFLSIFESHGLFSVDEEPDVFDAFVQWLYARPLIKEPSIEVALKLWTFGHRISCRKLQNCVMDYIQDYYLFHR